MTGPSIIRMLCAVVFLSALAAGFPTVSTANGEEAKPAVVKSPTNAPQAGVTVKAEPAIPNSEFTVPASIKEGTDPFFPSIGERVATTTPDPKGPAKAGPVDSGLVLQGIARGLCVINERTLAVGEEGDIEVSGRKLHVKCLEINETWVVIELGGERRELRFKPVK